MEKISINKNILTYRGGDYTILSHEIIGEEFIQITTETSTIAFIPKDTEINGVVAETIGEIIKYIND
jgi:hypothetical protein